MPRQVKRDITIHSSPDKVFLALITPSAIKKWWFAGNAIIYPKISGHYAVSWGANEDDPDYINFSRISVFDPPKRLVLTDFDYFSKTGPLPFEASLETEFILEKSGETTRLSVTQSGFLMAIKNFIES